MSTCQQYQEQKIEINIDGGLKWKGSKYYQTKKQMQPFRFNPLICNLLSNISFAQIKDLGNPREYWNQCYKTEQSTILDLFPRAPMTSIKHPPNESKWMESNF